MGLLRIDSSQTKQSCSSRTRHPNQVFVKPSTSHTYTKDSPLFTVPTIHFPPCPPTPKPPNTPYHPLPQDFLERLLRTAENRVYSKQGTHCMICLEDYNTLNTSTGIVEWEIRLPCGHGLGSSCIVTWLQTNNSCPACRSNVFSQQPRPYLEHGIMDTDRVRMATVPAPVRRVIPTARAAPVPTTTYRAVLKDLMDLILKSVREFAITFVAAALLVGVGVFLFRRIIDPVGIGRSDLRSRLPFAGPPSEGPAMQGRRCMDWQDCSFYFRSPKE